MWRSIGPCHAAAGCSERVKVALPRRNPMATRSTMTKPSLKSLAAMWLAVLGVLAASGCGGTRAVHLIHSPGSESMRDMTAAIERGEYDRIEAVVVERGGSVSYEAYFHKTDAETRIDARSAGKSITALAMGVAIDEGDIASVHEPLMDYFDDKHPVEHDDAVKRGITIEDVLTMSSALDCDDWHASPGNEERMYRSRDWTRFALDLPLDSAYARDATGRGRYSYCTAGAFLLGRVLERATGVAFDVYVQRKLFDPLGIVDPVWRRAPNGEVQSGGQLALRARDFAALGRLVLDRGRHGEQTLVSRQWLRQMLQPRVKASPRDGYGYLWWVRDFYVDGVGHPGFYMSGNGGNKMVVFPEFDTVAVVLTTNYNQANMHDLSTALVERYILPAVKSHRLETGTGTETGTKTATGTGTGTGTQA